MIFIEKFKVRWDDIDANMHLGNSKYLDYCSQTRMSFLEKYDIGLKDFKKYNIGPVVISENIAYFREILPSTEIYVTLELCGTSEDGSIYSFLHKFYDNKGINYAKAKVIGVWIDSIQRKKTIPPIKFLEAFKNIKSNYPPEIIDFEAVKNSGLKPENITEQEINNYYKSL